MVILQLGYTMSILPQLPKLMTLPGEIQNAIINLLDDFDKLVFRMTNRHFREIIPVSVDNLLAAEQASLSRGIDLYGCYDCLCLRRAAQFSDNMRKGKRGKQGSRPSSRFCIDCGLNPRSETIRYTPGSVIIVGGKRFVRCRCERYGIVPEDSLSKNRWVCNRCWEPIARRRRAKERLRYQQEKAARAHAKAEKRARLRELGWAGSDIEDMISEDTMSDEALVQDVEDDDIWSLYSD